MMPVALNAASAAALRTHSHGSIKLRNNLPTSLVASVHAPTRLGRAAVQLAHGTMIVPSACSSLRAGLPVKQHCSTPNCRALRRAGRPAAANRVVASATAATAAGDTAPKPGRRLLERGVLLFLAIAITIIAGVSWRDILFGIGFPIYLWVVNKVRFNENAEGREAAIADASIPLTLAEGATTAPIGNDQCPPTFALLAAPPAWVLQPAARFIGRYISAHAALRGRALSSLTSTISNCRPADRIGVGNKAEKWFVSYIRVFGLITVLFPLVTIAAAPLVLGEAAGLFVVEAAGPALALLLMQLFMESTISGPGRGYWHAIPRLLNPGAPPPSGRASAHLAPPRERLTKRRLTAGHWCLLLSVPFAPAAVGFNAFRLIALFEWLLETIAAIAEGVDFSAGATTLEVSRRVHHGSR